MCFSGSPILFTRRRTCCRPLCSILAGVAAADAGSRYILCLDDDVVVHPGALMELVAGLQADDSAFIATGAHTTSGL